jgi:hypothetical protein
LKFGNCIEAFPVCLDLRREAGDRRFHFILLGNLVHFLDGGKRRIETIMQFLRDLRRLVVPVFHERQSAP